jgi:hypothetical protein
MMHPPRHHNPPSFLPRPPCTTNTALSPTPRLLRTPMHCWHSIPTHPVWQEHNFAGLCLKEKAKDALGSTLVNIQPVSMSDLAVIRQSLEDLLTHVTVSAIAMRDCPRNWTMRRGEGDSGGTGTCALSGSPPCTPPHNPC